MSDTMMTVFVRLFHQYFIFYFLAWEIKFYTRNNMKTTRCSEVAFIDGSKEDLNCVQGTVSNLF
jgi:hypothetical protein